MGHNESSTTGTLIALSAYKKKLERTYTSSLTAHLKALEQKEANTHGNRTILYLMILWSGKN